MKILLTGGAGYIGSHTFLALAAAGHDAVILDNFCNSRRAIMPRLRMLAGSEPVVEEGDVCDRAFLAGVFARHRIGAVVHFAALKSITQSVAEPLAYYHNNVMGLVALLEAMAAAGCRTLVYSSSAAVYGAAETMPIAEDCPRVHVNPYGHSKIIGEDMLGALRRSDPAWRLAVLRYFNPVGAHPSGLIGEDPLGVPMNLMPYVAQVAVGRRPYLNVYGDDYPTPDGTGVRDYIHVMDLAEGHVAALRYLVDGGGEFTFNLGTGRGYSVLEIVAAFERASGKTIERRLASRRPGDVALCYADTGRTERVLGWKAARGLDEMCADAWNWQANNPGGLAN
jgi:UDP-glucose 4-epimerase